ncbi:MAG TPA: hypothetical protein VHC90_15560 [Bryobacteraceae bacterium]|nr:hypothetical protein [Bryobacteraceae bacterium]
MCNATTATVPSRATITMFLVAKTGIDFLEPWCEFVPGQADAFLRELKCELAPDHPLYSVQLHPLGHSGASDDAIFEAEDDRIFQVHLTLSGRAEEMPLPRFRVYANVAEWIQTVMLPANEDYRG